MVSPGTCCGQVRGAMAPLAPSNPPEVLAPCSLGAHGAKLHRAFFSDSKQMQRKSIRVIICRSLCETIPIVFRTELVNSTCVCVHLYRVPVSRAAPGTCNSCTLLH